MYVCRIARLVCRNLGEIRRLEGSTVGQQRSYEYAIQDDLSALQVHTSNKRRDQFANVVTTAEGAQLRKGWPPHASMQNLCFMNVQAAKVPSFCLPCLSHSCFQKSALF